MTTVDEMIGPRFLILLSSVCLCGLTSVEHALGVTRLVRTFDERTGLPSPVWSIDQDADGFIWIGTHYGVVRFDGREFKRWGESHRIADVHEMAATPQGDLYVVPSLTESVLRVTDGGYSPEHDADGNSLGGVRWIEATPDGATWALCRDGRLYRKPRDATWSLLATEKMRPIALSAGLGQSVFVHATSGTWKIDPDGTRELVLERQAADLVETVNGDLVVLTYSPASLVVVRNGQAIDTHELGGRPISIVMRGDVVWAAADHDLYRLENGVLSSVENKDFDHSAGELLVDREGSLWVAGFSSLKQFPEPDVLMWTTEDGLPRTTPRFVEATASGIWVGTWWHSGLLPFAESTRFREVEGLDGPADLCVDSRDVVWTVRRKGSGATRRAFIVAMDESNVHTFPDSPLGVSGCTRASDGAVWISHGEKVFKTGAPDQPPTLAGSLSLAQACHARLRLETRDTLWASCGGNVCSARVDESGIGDWSCSSLNDEKETYDIVETDRGNIWVATRGGVFTNQGGNWSVIPGSLEQPSEAYFRMRRSPLGGVWVSGNQPSIRVHDRPDTREGWQVEERVTTWMGSGRGVLELANGDLWSTTSRGVIHTPANIRFSKLDTPDVKITELRVGDDNRPPDRKVVLEPGQSEIEIRFSARAFRDPGAVRYRVRMTPAGSWTETRANSFLAASLAPGHYAPELIASIDGENWSSDATRLEVVVLAAWYRRWWAMLIWFTLAAALALAAYRVRVGFLVRMERQRTRIAMELHDELGAGLGSIGLLAEMVASDAVQQAERRSLAEQITATARHLGTGLTDIIWSLRQRSETLQALGEQVRDRALGLFPGHDTRVLFEFPTVWPQVRLPLVMRRNLQRIATEALHNASKHARARVIVVGAKPEGSRWTLWVEDDGVGLSEPSVSEDGLGLSSMRTRAEEIGGTLEVTHVQPHGTRVAVTFDPRARVRFR